MTQHDAGHERAGSALAGLRATDDAALEQALAAPSIPFFPGAGREQLLTQLEHWSRYGNGILIVEGSEQSGKTTLAGELHQRFGNEMTLLSICASGQTQSIDLLIEIADALGISRSTVAAWVRRGTDIYVFAGPDGQLVWYQIRQGAVA